MSVYALDIKTGTKNGAGTDANVSVILYSPYGQSRAVLLNPLISGNAFENGKTDHVELPNDIVDMGDIEAIHISHDNMYSGPGWFLESVTVTRRVAGGVRTQTFPCNKWLATDEDDKKIERLLGHSGEIAAYPRLRPFYIIGHNPNTIQDVLDFLSMGANAIEPDVNVYKNRTGELCFSHGKGDDGAPSLADYLDGLHRVVSDSTSNLALVCFDIKDAVQEKPDLVQALRDAVRLHLNTGSVNVNVIFSIDKVPSEKDPDPFALIAGDLQGNEALMVDSENDPAKVRDYFQQHNGLMNYCYGNGISFDFRGNEWQNIRGSIKAAAAMRDVFGFVEAWTINLEDYQKSYIDFGADGIIVDKDIDTWNSSSLAGITNIVPLVNNHYGGVRLATRHDVAFGSAFKVSAIITGTNMAAINLTYGQSINLASLNLRASFGMNDPASLPGSWEYQQDGKTVSATTPIFPQAGQSMVSVYFNPSDKVHYNAATTTVQIHVAQANPIVTVEGCEVAFDGTPHGTTGSAKGVNGKILPVTLSYQGTTKLGMAYGPTADPPTLPGDYVVTASTPGDANHTSGSSTAKLIITPAAAVVTAVEALNVRKDHSVHANVVRWLRNNDKIAILDFWRTKGEVWVQLGSEEWSAMEYEGNTYIEISTEAEKAGAKAT